MKRNRQDRADHDDEQAATADADAEEIEAAAKFGRQVDELLLAAHEIIGTSNRHEDEADGEEDLVEMRGAIELAIERDFQCSADQRGGEKCCW